MSSFGADFEEVWPKPGSTIKFTEFGTKLLQKCLKVEKPDVSHIDVKSFIKKSSNFPVEVHMHLQHRNSYNYLKLLFRLPPSSEPIPVV